jgi:hypothetical protein
LLEKVRGAEIFNGLLRVFAGYFAASEGKKRSAPVETSRALNERRSVVEC